MTRYTIDRLPYDQHEALCTAITLGALAQRQATLATLIKANRDYPQVADNYERELTALRRAADAVLRATPVEN